MSDIECHILLTPACPMSDSAIISNFTIILLIIGMLSTAIIAITIVVHVDLLTYLPFKSVGSRPEALIVSGEVLNSNHC